MPYDDGGLPPLGPAPALPEGTDDSGRWGGGDGRREPTWRDPLLDITFGAIPDALYPSDHLAVGGELVVLGTGGAAAVALAAL